jgi:hypothetical protein
VYHADKLIAALKSFCCAIDSVFQRASCIFFIIRVL